MSDIPGVSAEGIDPDLNAGIPPTEVPDDPEDDTADEPDVLETPDREV
ncbi:hypothetical protein KXS11_17140 [Plantibacter flavus]